MSDEDLEKNCIEDNEDVWEQKIEDDKGVKETLEDAARDKNEVSVKVQCEKESKDIVLKEEIFTQNQARAYIQLLSTMSQKAMN